MDEEFASVTIFMDESGTPADSEDDGLFVVGGFSIRGDTNRILGVWNDFLNQKGLNDKKGTKYSDENFLDLSEFIFKNKIIPLTSHSYLDNGDVHNLFKKIERFRQIAEMIKSNSIQIKPATYVWTMQVAITIVSSIISLLIENGKISKCYVSTDKYLSNVTIRSIIDQVVAKFIEPSKIRELIEALPRELLNHPNTIKLISSIERAFEYVQLDFNARGKFKIMADGVCAMYRKQMLGNAGAKAAWHVIKTCYTINNRTPLCIGNDVTKYMKNVVRTPWVAPSPIRP